jgi:pimeloyl-ACP methyl ester carboxylesterase
VINCVAANVQEEIIPECGHWITEEQPQLTTQLIVEFLNRSTSL